MALWQDSLLKSRRLRKSQAKQFPALSSSRPKRKDLRSFGRLPRSPIVSYVARAAEGFHYTLSAMGSEALWQWVTEYFGNRLGPRHKFNTYENTPAVSGIYKLGDNSVIGGRADANGEIRLTIAGDWGTGTDEAAEASLLTTPSISEMSITWDAKTRLGRTISGNETRIKILFHAGGPSGPWGVLHLTGITKYMPWAMHISTCFFLLWACDLRLGVTLLVRRPASSVRRMNSGGSSV